MIAFVTAVYIAPSWSLSYCNSIPMEYQCKGMGMGKDPLVRPGDYPVLYHY